MLQPVRTKYRKAHKGRIHGTATRAAKINYGSFDETGIFQNFPLPQQQK